MTIEHRKTFVNNTNKKLIIKFEEQYFEVMPNKKAVVIISDNNIGKNYIKIYVSENRTFYIRNAEYYSANEVIEKGTIWRQEGVYNISFDAFILTTRGNDHIFITEEIYHNLYKMLFNVLLLNGNEADKYDYHNKTDKFKHFYNQIISIFPFIIVFLLTILGVYDNFIENNVILFDKINLFIYVTLFLVFIVLFNIFKKKLFCTNFKKNNREIIKLSEKINIVSEKANKIVFTKIKKWK